MIHMHTPPKVFIQAWRKHTQMAKAKPGAYVKEEIGTQNIIGKKKVGTCIIRTIGNTQRGGGT